MESVRMTGSRKELLDSYTRRIAPKSLSGRLPERTALRNQSVAIREIFAHAASFGRMDSVAVERQVLHGRFTGLDPEWLARLARVRALQDFTEEDTQFALVALRWANRHLPQTAATVRFYKLEVELLAEAECFEDARALVASNEYLRDINHDYMSVDLINPFVRLNMGLFTEWLTGFNEPFRAQNIRPVKLIGSASKPYDRLSSASLIGPELENAPLVSIIMTVFRPDREAVLLSAKSILNQSWRHLELIVVDDASPSDYDATVNELAELDPRVRLIRRSVNGGTYLARNAGLREAQGAYITGQDADDWSHPDRILTQVRFMERNPQVPGVVTSAIRTDENLVRMWRGWFPERRCEVSLMVKADIAREIGGYLPARKAADSEFRERLVAYTGIPVPVLEDPLYVIRILHDSLSRSDFKPEWSHQNRRNFSSAFSYWHRRSLPTSLVVDDKRRSPVPVPPKFEVIAPDPQVFDVVFAGDWRFDGPQQRQVLDEIALLLGHGWTVGILQIESALAMDRGNMSFVSDGFQDLINRNKIAHLSPDDRASADLLILRDPSTMQFPSNGTCSIAFQRCLLVVDETPQCRLTGDMNYLAAECAENIQDIFGVSPLWVPVDAEVREALERETVELSECNLPPSFLPNRWRTDRTHLRNRTPVIGRFGSSSPKDWPQDALAIESMWPTGEGWDTRMLGEVRVPLKRLRQNRPPEGWTVFQPRDISSEVFLKSLDFYVHFGGTNRAMVRRQLGEAMAAGCVVIAACEGAEDALLDGVIYVDPKNVYTELLGYLASPQRRRAAARAARDAVTAWQGSADYEGWLRDILDNVGPRDGAMR